MVVLRCLGFLSGLWIIEIHLENLFSGYKEKFWSLALLGAECYREMISHSHQSRGRFPAGL